MAKRERPPRKDITYIDPRKIFVEEGFNKRTDWGDMESLKQSIIKNGIKSPLRVYKVFGAESYGLINGERRLKSVMEILKEGKHEIARIPAMIVEKRDVAERLLESFIDNDGKPFTMLEEAQVCKQFITYGWTAAEIAERTGRTTTTISNLLVLADAPQEVKKTVEKKKISGSAVVDLMRNKKDGDQVNAIVKKATKGGKKKVTPKNLPSGDKQIRKVPISVCRDLGNALAARFIPTSVIQEGKVTAFINEYLKEYEQ